MAWSAGQYSLFETERNRPVVDLLAQVASDPVRTAADIGCGPGNSTELLQARYKQATIMGMDSSPEMVAAARARLPSSRFEIDDIATWREQGPFDLILANAALQWVPDHATLLPALVGKLAPGGSLAVQIPDNVEEPTHVLMRKIAEDGPWASRIGDAWLRWANRHPPDWYYLALRGIASSIDIWRTTYFHQLEGGSGAIVEWVKGTSLRPFLAPLTDAERMVFLKRYEDEIAKAYPVEPDGTVLLPFPRLFWVATK